MKNRKDPKCIIALLVSVLLIMGALTGCGGSGSTGSSDSESADVVTFTDSAGREVEIPAEINKIAPSGTVSQMFLLTLCPEKLMGLGSEITESEKEYLPDYIQELPVFGKFYNTGAGDVNYEEIIAAQPDIIIDVGEVKDGIAEDMDGIQEKTGIPVVFIETTIQTTADTYKMLGEITGCSERAEELAEYSQNVLDQIDEGAKKIKDSEKVRVYLGDGEFGTQPNPAGSFHSEAVEMTGAVNVADIGEQAKSGAQDVSMEQIITWNPQVIILYPGANYDTIESDSKWASIDAVKNGRVYEVPSAPYNWLDRPPSIQRIIGMQWLGNLLYPDVFDYDMVKTAQDYYKLFYNYDLSEDAAKDILSKSTLKLKV